MSSKNLTGEQIQYVKENYSTKSNKELASYLNCAVSTIVSISYKLHLHKSKEYISALRSNLNKNRKCTKKIECQMCGKIITISGFNQKYCPECRIKIKQKRALNAGRKWKARHKIEKKLGSSKYIHDIKQEVFEHYGGSPPKCECCNEDELKFLVIDHIEGCSKELRKEQGTGHKFYRWLKRNNYPFGYRVLCANCNQALANYNFCPHKMDERYEQIDRILLKIKSLWKLYDQQRLGQLLDNYAFGYKLDSHLFYIEDDIIEERLRKVLELINKK